MSKNKKIIISILIVLLIIGVAVVYKLIEKSVTNRESFKFNVENISSNPVDTKNLDEKKSTDNFEIMFSNKKPTDSYKVYTILSKTETDKYDYTIYGYNGIVNIKIDGKDYLLKDALLENKITMEEIIAKANKDLPNAISYDDGGSMEYHYENYTIIKCHRLDGNRDVYIGTKEMTLNDVI